MREVTTIPPKRKLQNSHTFLDNPNHNPPSKNQNAHNRKIGPCTSLEYTTTRYSPRLKLPKRNLTIDLRLLPFSPCNCRKAQHHHKPPAVLVPARNKRTCMIQISNRIGLCFLFLVFTGFLFCILCRVDILVRFGINPPPLPCFPLFFAIRSNQRRKTFKTS